ncbi:NAB2 [Candida jiufengensis]|uniref:NAB2 n=1 Tax=Candida jiufengensis TaxID=497108 RepID=UPI002224F1CA|nr:NAB2 [Candida jiufengensis]KAI5955762.1 NAB2 [Candida jiufengensis]
MALTPDSKVSDQLKQSLMAEIIRRYGIGPEDAQDIAEYIIYCIVSNKSQDVIVTEVKEIADIPIDSEFVSQVYVELQNIENRLAQQNRTNYNPTSTTHSQNHQHPQVNSVTHISQDSYQPQSRTQSQVNQPSNQEYKKPEASTSRVTNRFSNTASRDSYKPSSTRDTQNTSSARDNYTPSSARDNYIPSSSRDPRALNRSSSSIPPTGPKKLNEKERLALRSKRFGVDSTSSSLSSRNKIINGGIGKKPTDRSSISKRPPQVTKQLEAFVASGGKDSNNTTKFVPRPPKGRCPDFPHCSNKECPFSHPTKNCFAYPDCPNPPGTCNFIHPDQDQELIAKLEQSEKEYEAKQKNLIMLEQGSCRFGLKCAKENCPFAHPTPSNADAKIETLEWCKDGVNCQNKECNKSHPRPPNAEIKTLPSSTQIALEQCKFGMKCTNYKCPRRHATSAVPCRAGAECRRLDCTFNHPLAEPCRFGSNCSSAMCMYQHPEGRITASHHWTKDGISDAHNGNIETNNRQFAVNEDQVMEQVAQD